MEMNTTRLNTLLKKIFPGQAAAIDAGEWGAAGAPYAFATLADGRMRLTVENRETGDRIGVVGTSRAELLDQLERRIG